MKLKELLAPLDVRELHADPELDITGISYDSRTTQPGELFVAVTGFAADGHKFIPKAVERGAAAILCERAPEADVPYVVAGSTRRALALVSAAWFGHPADHMTMIGVTGTNGKTTSTYLLKHILEQTLGAKVGLVGTIQNMIGDEVLETERTTPESFELQKLFAEMYAAGCTHVIMEVSSHALTLDRVAGVHFAVGFFTNLTEDHLDFHKDMEDYCDAKGKLFGICDTGCVNADDPWTPRLIKNATCRMMCYSTKSAADLTAEHIALHSDGVEFDAASGGERAHVRLGIPGAFTVYNALGVIQAAQAARKDRRRALYGAGRQGPRRGRAHTRKGLYRPHRLFTHAGQPREHFEDRARLLPRARHRRLWLRRRPRPLQAPHHGRYCRPTRRCGRRHLG